MSRARALVSGLGRAHPPPPSTSSTTASVLTNVGQQHAQKWRERGFAHAAVTVPELEPEPELRQDTVQNTMKDTHKTKSRVRGWFRSEQCHLEDLQLRCEKAARLHDYFFASEIQGNVVIYDKGLIPASNTEAADLFSSEVVDVLATGPGVMVVRGAFDASAVDDASIIFEGIIDEERQTGRSSGDHFAQAGINDRIWNGLGKLATASPRTFADYYNNDVLALVSRSWLGPGYQVTSQVNVVGPGSLGQSMHRDYHLGFQPMDRAERYPAHVHKMNPMLTLQAAVAHVDMPLESGPTTFLPFSQTYPEGYLATNRDDFKAYYADHCTQLPLSKGDLVVFNPATFHAAGVNSTEHVRRMANLLQVSSPFARSMESVDRAAVVRAVYPELLNDVAVSGMDTTIENVVFAAAEGYAFPTNLDLNTPVGGCAPTTQADIVLDALRDELAPQILDGLLARQETGQKL